MSGDGQLQQKVCRANYPSLRLAGKSELFQTAGCRMEHKGKPPCSMLGTLISNSEALGQQTHPSPYAYARPTDASRRLIASGHTPLLRRGLLVRPSLLLVGLARFARPTDAPCRLVASGRATQQLPNSYPTARPIGRLTSLLVGLARYAGPTDAPRRLVASGPLLSCHQFRIFQAPPSHTVGSPI